MEPPLLARLIVPAGAAVAVLALVYRMDMMPELYAWSSLVWAAGLAAAVGMPVVWYLKDRRR